MKYISLTFICYILLLGCQDDKLISSKNTTQRSPNMTTFVLDKKSLMSFDTSDAFLINGIMLKQGKNDSISFIPPNTINLDNFFLLKVY